MYRLKAEYSEFEIGVIFKILDPDNIRLIDAEDFSVMMINVLYLSISRKTRSKDDELKLYLQKLGGSCPCGFELLTLFTSDAWRYFMLVVQSIDICALLSYHQFPELCNIVDFICIIMILIALVVDVVFQHMSQLKTYFKSSRNRLYFGLTLIQTVGTCIGIKNERSWISALRFFGMLRVLIVAVFALEKIKFLRTSLTRTLTQTVIAMIPVFLRIVVHIVIVLLYIYTIIGMELFVNPDEATWGRDRCIPHEQVQYNPYAVFCDSRMTIITLTQILATNNWHEIMYKAIEVTENWFYAVYFVTLFFLGPILVVSLLLAMFFNMFFGVAMQSEHELSAFFNETDQEAKHLQEHMELQDIKQQIDHDLQNQSVPLPTEVGIATLENGAKILTIRRPKVRDNDDNVPISPFPEDGGPGDDESNYENETKAQEMELVHIPLDTVTRQIFEHVPGEDWQDPVSKDTYKQTFNGRDATQYLLDAGFAPNGEEAVDYLAIIMDEIGAFMRVDSGKEQEFENDADTHYQWIHVPDNDQDDQERLRVSEDGPVALDEIVVGFRHSYGGYQRLIKQYRIAGIDPQQEAARLAAAKHAGSNSPLSGLGDDKDKAMDREKSNSPEENKPIQEKIGEHIRQKSEKLLKAITKDKNANQSDVERVNSMSPVNTTASNANANDLDLKSQMDADDEEENVVDEDDDNSTVIMTKASNSNNQLHKALPNTQMGATSTTSSSQAPMLPPLAPIESDSSDQGKQKTPQNASLPDMHKSSKRPNSRNIGSLELGNLKKKHEAKSMLQLKKTQSHDNSSLDLRRQQNGPSKVTSLFFSRYFPADIYAHPYTLECNPTAPIYHVFVFCVLPSCVFHFDFVRVCQCQCQS